MSVLYYWRPDNYHRDRRFGFGYHLNQGSAALARMQPGERVWAFTRNREGRYVLAASLLVRAVTRNPPRYRYGAFRVWGDLDASRYFEIDDAPSIEAVVREAGVPASGPVLGRAFQGHAAVRPISAAADAMFAAFAESLPVLPRVRIYPEDEFEARLFLGEGARDLLRGDAGGDDEARVRYLFETVNVRRARRHVLWLQQRYGGRCQICEFDGLHEYGHQLCHAHHIHWLGRGGEDRLRNMVLVCPTHHSAIHKDDAPFDYAAMEFRFSIGRTERLRLNEHLPRAA